MDETPRRQSALLLVIPKIRSLATYWLSFHFVSSLTLQLMPLQYSFESFALSLLVG
jgi:hypothetical protein